MIDTVRGVLRVRKWPKKRDTPRSASKRFWVDWFRQANLLAKYADPMSQVRSKEMTKGSGLYPRDVLLMAMRGRLYAWADTDGWKWYPVAAIGDISESLDVLAQTVGSILVRAVDRWRTPTPGAINDVLTLKGTPAIPEWVPAAGGGVPFGGALLNKLTDQAITNGVFTAIIFDAQTYDTDDLHDTTTNPTRLTVPANWSRVRLTAGVNWIVNSTGTRILFFRKNGANFLGQAWSRNQAKNESQNSIGSPPIDVVEDDYFELIVWHDRGATINIVAPNDNVYFAMERAT